MSSPSSDHHRKTAIEWLDRFQSSVPSPPVRSGYVKNPFDIHGDESEESDDGQTQQLQQHHVQPRRRSPGLNDSPHILVGPNTLVESDIDAYADDAVPIGLLANLAISTSNDVPAISAEQKSGRSADDDDVVRSLFCRLHRKFHRERRARLTRRFPYFLDRESLTGSFSCPAHHSTSPCASP